MGSTSSKGHEAASQGLGAADTMPQQAQSTTVGELMSRSVVCLNSDARIAHVVQMFLDRSLSSAPVVDDAWRPLGMVSKTDLLRAVQEQHHNAATPPPEYLGGPEQQGRVREIITPFVLSLHEEAPVCVAAALMAYEGVHRLPIVASTGEVVGVISTLDILKWMARCDESAKAAGVSR
ncbi:MAG: CBS domain-containing protein [Deltaproteobacteria bacterium]|nr:MAG: CBS domain-containing protein [Deltaproteobacteria bacterium]